MARFVTTIASPLPPEEAFGYMADLANFAEWDPGVRQVQQVSGDGPGIGAEFDVELNGFRGPMTLTYKTTTYDPPGLIVAEANSERLRSLDRITVAPTEGGSAVTYDAELTMKGILGLADPLLALAFDRIGQKAETGLIKALQGQKI